MDLQLSHKQQMLSNTFETLSLEHLLDLGRRYVQQGHYAEAAALFAVVRAQLTSDTSSQTHLACLLDTFLQEYASYRSSQQVLRDAGIRFAEAQRAQQERIHALSSMVSTLLDISCGEEVVGEDSKMHTDIAPIPLSTPEETKTELLVVCFGQFGIKVSGKPVVLCASRNGQAILRYLIAQAGHNAKSDTLLALFWPDDEPEVAQRKLHIAVSSLRRSLVNAIPIAKQIDCILYKNHVYMLNPAIDLRADIDDFLYYFHKGQQESQNEQQRTIYYEHACQLYAGPFLSEDIYADWSFLQREHLTQAYIVMCNVLADYSLRHEQYEDAARWATAILQEDRCDEAAHRQLIQIYMAQGRRSEAHKQYQRCEQTMREELGVKLLPETVGMFQQLFGQEELLSIKPK